MPKSKARRGANGGGTLYHRADGRWEGRYTVGFDPGTGRRLPELPPGLHGAMNGASALPMRWAAVSIRILCGQTSSALQRVSACRMPVYTICGTQTQRLRW